MKLVIFTPSNQASAIGRMTALVSQALVHLGHDVTIVRTEVPKFFEKKSHDFGADIISWNDHAAVQKKISDSDHCVYQIGNSFEFHEGGLHWLKRAPGIVCLHDFYLGHLFWGWSDNRRSEAQTILNTWYTRELGQKFFNYSNAEDFLAGTSTTTPMTEWVCSMASAVITHSNWGCDAVLRSCAGPVRIVPLAYDAPGLKSVQPKSQNKDKLTLLTIGHVNPNKRAESVIQAIGANDVLKTRLT